jgi:hypothetical protein
LEDVDASFVLSVSGFPSSYPFANQLNFFLFTTNLFAQIYFVASLGRPFNPSSPSLPILLKSTPSSCLTPLPSVAGSLSPAIAAAPVAKSASVLPDPTLTFLPSAEFHYRRGKSAISYLSRFGKKRDENVLM